MKAIRTRIAAGLMVLAAYGAGARTLYVSPQGTNDYAGYYPGWAGAATTISAAVSRASSEDSVFVTNTTYLLTTNIVVTTGITVRSYNNGAFDPTNTILNGQGVVRCLYINHTNALVAGFTITNGVGTGSVDVLNGGGVYMGGAEASGGTLSNCIVQGNTAQRNGGGVYAYGSACLLADCRLIGNTVATNQSNEGGGGAFVYKGTIRNSTMQGNGVNGMDASKYYCGGGGLLLHTTAIADGCRIVSNTAWRCGGGAIMMNTTSGGKMLNCVVANNTQTKVTDTGTETGGGIYLFTPAVGTLIQGCVIVSNSALYGGGVNILINHVGTGGGVTISNCVVSYNTGDGVRQTSPAADRIPDIRIYNTTIEGNISPGSYGGVDVTFGLIVDGCVIRNNRGRHYGGLTIEGGSATSTVRNCLIAGNTSTSTWGAAGLTIPSNTFVQSCTIVSNVATHASSGKGGLHFASDGGTVSNTIVMFNTGTASNWSFEAGATPRLAYGCTMPTNGLTGASNIAADPLLKNRAAGEYQLTAASPCINTGANQEWMTTGVDLDGRPRLDRFHRRVDMGAYEFLPHGTMFISK